MVPMNPLDEPRVVLPPDGLSVPALGLGTWRMGEDARRQAAEVHLLRAALEMGYRLIDTAEMYGEGGAETVVGQALADALRVDSLRREDVFVVSKVVPQHGSAAGMRQACERSLRRLGLDCIDLYLLHWPGSHPLAETVQGFEALQQRGWIRRWGVSNFDLPDMRQLMATLGGTACSANQVYYSLTERGPGFELLPWLQSQGIALMAYSPIDQGALAHHPLLQALASDKGLTPAQLALAWLMAQPGVMAIPKTARESRLAENLASAGVRLDPRDRAQLDRLFPPPRRRRPLAMR